MRILYITTAYPPFFDMQTIRNIKLINRLVELGNSITVLTPEVDWLINQYQDASIRKEVEVWRTPTPPFIKFQHFLSRKKSLRLFLKIFNIAINYLPIPDIFAGWSLVSKNTIELKLKTNEFDIVITSSGGYSAHYIGNNINKKFKIPWVADYGDPWGLNIYGQKKYFLYVLEKRILANCSGLFFTTQSTINAYKKKYKLSDIPVFNLPCGFDDNYNYVPELKKNDDFLIVYTGVAYSLSRNLSNAVIAIAGINNPKCDFKIVGSYSEKFVNLSKSLNATNIHFLGKVDFNTSIKIILKADILLHIGNFGSLQIPGKTYIYLGTSKPILYIKQEAKADPTLELLNQFEGVIVSENNPKSIENSLKEIINNYDYYYKQSIKRVESVNLKNYTWNNIGSYFDKCLKEIEIIKKY